jgi:transposase InsO family protein
MPWKEESVVDQRQSFITAWLKQEYPFKTLCRGFGISRQTGYKWIARFTGQGHPGLQDESRAPQSSPHAVAARLQNAILALRHQHPTWGPKKLLALLQERSPGEPWPAPSTIGELLRRAGLAHPRPLRRRTPLHSEPLAHAAQPNQVWCADFKGYFFCGDGRRCDPLTLTDAYSRYLLRCRAVPKTDGPTVRRVFEAAFREFGLPDAIRTDNGTPFASPGIAGLSRLSVWWIRLGIRPERIDPGCPEQNGRHERFHETLKAETASPPSASLSRQQRAFADFQREYNEVRPHEALGQRPPARFYRPSSRPFPNVLPHLAYPFACTLRSVSAAGHISWRSHQIHLSVLLENQDVALRELEDGLLEVHFGPLLLGWLDEPSATFSPNRTPPRRLRRRSPH